MPNQIDPDPLELIPSPDLVRSAIAAAETRVARLRVLLDVAERVWAARPAPHGLADRREGGGRAA